MKLALVALFLAAACGTEDSSSSTSLTRLPGECGDVETHVFGVAELPDDGDSSDPVILRVERPGKHAIVVSAEVAATWKITAAPGAEIVQVYAVGRGKQTVIAPAGVEVITESEAEGGGWACGYSWPGGEGCDTKQLLRLASIRMNRHATSFHGCYAAREWTIGEDMTVTSDCATGHVQSDIITRCDADTDESNCDDVVLY